MLWKYRRLLSYLLQLLRRNLHINTIPLIWFDPTLACNLSCEMCPWAQDGYHDNSYFPLDQFFDLCRSFKKIRVRNVHVGVNAEPLVHPHINEILDLLLSLKIKTRVLTNLNCSNKTTLAKLAKVNSIWTSIDGGDKTTYESIRKGGNWDLLCENLKFLSSKRRIVVHFVLMEKNYKTLPDLCRTLRELNNGGISGINIKVPQFHHMKDEEKEFRKKFLKQESIPEFISILEKSREIASDFLVNFHEQPAQYLSRIVKEGRREGFGEYPCFSILSSLYIDSKGNVKPCCEALFSDYSYGNLSNQKLETIINSDTFIQQTKSLISLGLDGKPEFCTVCGAQLHKFYYNAFKKLGMNRLFGF